MFIDIDASPDDDGEVQLLPEGIAELSRRWCAALNRRRNVKDFRPATREGSRRVRPARRQRRPEASRRKDRAPLNKRGIRCAHDAGRRGTVQVAGAEQPVFGHAAARVGCIAITAAVLVTRTAASFTATMSLPMAARGHSRRHWARSSLMLQKRRGRARRLA
jgi:hypothetical protein